MALSRELGRMWRIKGRVIPIPLLPIPLLQFQWLELAVCLHLFTVSCLFKFCFIYNQLFVYISFSNFVFYILFRNHLFLLFIYVFCLRLTICLHSVKNWLFVYICLQSAACLELAVWLHFVGKYLNLQRNCKNFALQWIFQKW